MSCRDSQRRWFFIIDLLLQKHASNTGFDHLARETSQPDQNIAAVYEDILAAEDSGIQVKRPLGDPEMATVYRRAKVHLYPIIANEVYCGTLAESQASGLPAVINAAARG